MGGIKATFTISYQYYDDEKVLLVHYNDDIVKEPTRISLVDKSGDEIMGGCKWESHSPNAVEKNQMLCSKSNAPLDGLEDSLIQATKNIRSSLIEQCKPMGISVESYPPIAVYKNGYFDSSYNPEADYSEEYTFAMVDTTNVITDVFLAGQEFANIIGSTGDPKPYQGTSWIVLYRNMFDLTSTPPLCGE